MEMGRWYRQIRLKSGIREKVQVVWGERWEWADGRGRLEVIGTGDAGGEPQRRTRPRLGER